MRLYSRDLILQRGGTAVERILWRPACFARLLDAVPQTSEADRERLQRFFERAGRTMYAAAVRELGDRTRAEDAVHNAFVVLLERFGGDADALEQLSRGYLITLTVWKARQLRRNERRCVYGGEEDWETLPDRRDTMAELDTREQLLWLLSAAPEGYRELLRLRLVLGLSNKETARQLGLSENTASVRYRRGVEHLRKLLEKEESL